MIKIVNIADIRFGIHAEAATTGIPYLQVGQFSEEGTLISEPAEMVNILENEDACLKDGDVLLVGKGNRHFAWCYKQEMGPYVASSSFFIIRPYKNRVLPEYLAAILNLPHIKGAFKKMGAGTNIFSIRKSELADFEIPLPALPVQKRMANLTESHQKELALCRELINQKQNLYTAIISKMLK